MEIIILGPGCSKCKTLEKLTRDAVKELGIIASVSKVLNLTRMDAGITEYHMEKYSIPHLVAIGLSKVQPIAQRKNITLEFLTSSHYL